MTIQSEITPVNPAAEELLSKLSRTIAAQAVMTAVMECDPRDRASLLEAIFKIIRPGQPIAPFGEIMDEASWWADMASDAERKAYGLASVTRLSKKDQIDLVEYLRGECA